MFEHANDVPYSDDDLGSGIKSVYGQPAYHKEDLGRLKSMNKTLPGHVFHPGEVRHRVHFEDGTLYYEVNGRGSGPYPYVNNAAGIGTFLPGVYRVVRGFGF